MIWLYVFVRHWRRVQLGWAVGRYKYSKLRRGPWVYLARVTITGDTKILDELDVLLKARDVPEAQSSPVALNSPFGI